MSRGGRDKDRSEESERKCIATGETQPKSGLIRFVVGPENQVAPDLAEKLPGRGIWVSSTRAALDKAAKKGLFARAAKAPVTVPDDLPALMEQMLVRRVIELISLARKSGAAVAGYEKVKDWLGREDARVLIQAENGSERGKSKLSTPYGGNYIGWLTAEELGLAFGREKVIHAALGAGGLTKRVVEEAQRLKGLRVELTGAASTAGAVEGGKGRRKGQEKLNER
ncbi:RNA-binding protein [Salipiger sp.]|uniref:RNA-binding protein n=1 Tax=Salipiger sp. TaxID=2078585 RepID=UPI003A983037